MAIAAFLFQCIVLLQIIQAPMRLLDRLLGNDQSLGQLANIALDVGKITLDLGDPHADILQLDDHHHHLRRMLSRFAPCAFSKADKT